MKPETLEARDVPVLMPTIVPLSSMSGLPGIMMSGEMLVSITDEAPEEGGGMTAVTMPWLMRGTRLPESTTTEPPS